MRVLWRSRQLEVDRSSVDYWSNVSIKFFSFSQNNNTKNDKCVWKPTEKTGSFSRFGDRNQLAASPTSPRDVSVERRDAVDLLFLLHPLNVRTCFLEWKGRPLFHLCDDSFDGQIDGTSPYLSYTEIASHHIHMAHYFSIVAHESLPRQHLQIDSIEMAKKVHKYPKCFIALADKSRKTIWV